MPTLSDPRFYGIYTCTSLVEFQGYPSMKWKPALFEKCVVEQLLKEQFHQYIDRVQKSDCARELRRLLASGPPIYLSDEHGFPLTEGDTHIVNLWFASDKKERSAKLEGAKEGEEREELWNTLKDCYSEKKVSHDHNDQKEK